MVNPRVDANLIVIELKLLDFLENTRRNKFREVTSK